MAVSKADSVSEMTDVVLACRLNHHWSWRGDTEIIFLRNQLASFVRHFECERCGTDKWETIDGETFKVRRSKTDYPDGYLCSSGRVGKSDVRREQFTRANGSAARR